MTRTGLGLAGPAKALLAAQIDVCCACNTGQKPQLAADAARFVQLSVPAVFFTGIAECLKRYLMAQGVVFPAAGETL